MRHKLVLIALILSTFIGFAQGKVVKTGDELIVTEYRGGIAASAVMQLPKDSLEHALPGVPLESRIRFNPATKKFEGHNGVAWGPLGGESNQTLQEVIDYTALTQPNFYVNLPNKPFGIQRENAVSFYLDGDGSVSSGGGGALVSSRAVMGIYDQGYALMGSSFHDVGGSGHNRLYVRAINNIHTKNDWSLPVVGGTVSGTLVRAINGITPGTDGNVFFTPPATSFNSIVGDPSTNSALVEYINSIGSSNGKFGIEDNATTQNRIVEMGGFDFALNNMSSFKLGGLSSFALTNDTDDITFIPDATNIGLPDFINKAVFSLAGMPIPGVEDNVIVVVTTETDDVELEFTKFIWSGNTYYIHDLLPENTELVGYYRLQSEPLDVTIDLPEDGGLFNNDWVLGLDNNGKIVKKIYQEPIISDPTDPSESGTLNDATQKGNWSKADMRVSQWGEDSEDYTALETRSIEFHTGSLYFPNGTTTRIRTQNHVATENNIIELPAGSGTLPLSVNGISADMYGNINLGNGGGTTAQAAFNAGRKVTLEMNGEGNDPMIFEGKSYDGLTKSFIKQYPWNVQMGSYNNNADNTANVGSLSEYGSSANQAYYTQNSTFTDYNTGAQNGSYLFSNADDSSAGISLGISLQTEEETAGAEIGVRATNKNDRLVKIESKTFEVKDKDFRSTYYLENDPINGDNMYFTTSNPTELTEYDGCFFFDINSAIFDRSLQWGCITVRLNIDGEENDYNFCQGTGYGWSNCDGLTGTSITLVSAQLRTEGKVDIKLSIDDDTYYDQKAVVIDNNGFLRKVPFPATPLTLEQVLTNSNRATNKDIFLPGYSDDITIGTLMESGIKISESTQYGDGSNTYMQLLKNRIDMKGNNYLGTPYSISIHPPQFESVNNGHKNFYLPSSRDGGTLVTKRDARKMGIRTVKTTDTNITYAELSREDLVANNTEEATTETIIKYNGTANGVLELYDLDYVYGVSHTITIANMTPYTVNVVTDGRKNTIWAGGSATSSVVIPAGEFWSFISDAEEYWFVKKW